MCLADNRLLRSVFALQMLCLIFTAASLTPALKLHESHTSNTKKAKSERSLPIRDVCDERSPLADWGNMYMLAHGVSTSACAVTIVTTGNSPNVDGCAVHDGQCPGTIEPYYGYRYNSFVQTAFINVTPDVKTQKDFETWLITALQMAGNSTDVSTVATNISSLLNVYLRSDNYALWVDEDANVVAKTGIDSGIGGTCLFFQGKSLGGLSVVAFAKSPSNTSYTAAV